MSSDMPTLFTVTPDGGFEIPVDGSPHVAAHAAAPATPPGRADVVQQLQPYVAAGVLEPADVHLGAALVRLGAVRDDDAVDVALAVALASRAPRHGHTCVDLGQVVETVTAEVDVVTHGGDAVDPVAALRWPSPEAWVGLLATCSLVTAPDPPLALVGRRLALSRYRAYELAVARELLERAAAPAEPAPAAALSSVAQALLQGEGADEQLEVVRRAHERRLTVLVGGPGTGKTTTVAALLASLLDRPRTGEPLRIALAAPTGKAAARMGEAFRRAADQLPGELGERLAATDALTVHRLLRPVAGSRTRFRHHRGAPLPHDVVIVDETSMVSLPLMAKLLDAVRPDARVVLVGDPGQLTSVEAGDVLADVVVSAIAMAGSTGGPPLAACVAELRHGRRFPTGSPVDVLAAAVRSGDADAALHVLAGARTGGGAGPDARGAVDWIPAAGDDADVVEQVAALIVPPALATVDAAGAGRAADALGALEQVRTLCAHRHGPFGVARWNQLVESRLRDAGVRTAGWYAGRPVLITANDHRAGLYNGDLGVAVATGATGANGANGTSVAFASTTGVRLVPPGRLDAVETVHAMTIHKSQGSEFDHVVVVLPPASSRLATRDLVYTAITRARARLTVVGDEAALRAAIGRRTVRTTGLRQELWGTIDSWQSD